MNQPSETETALFKRVELIFYVLDEDDLPDFDVLKDSLEEIFPKVLKIDYGSSIDTVEVLIGLLLETRNLHARTKQGSLQKLHNWFRERDKILSALGISLDK